MLRSAVLNSKCVADVMRILGIRRSGGSHSHLTRRLKYYDIDISHFTGKSLSRGRPSPKKKTPNQILMLKTSGQREAAVILRRALIEIGTDYKCSCCGLGPVWNNKELRLHVDHINKNWLDNRRENLRFLCPNCHTQTEGFCGSKGLCDVTSNNRGQRVRRLQKMI